MQITHYPPHVANHIPQITDYKLQNTHRTSQTDDCKSHPWGVVTEGLGGLDSDRMVKVFLWMLMMAFIMIMLPVHICFLHLELTALCTRLMARRKYLTSEPNISTLPERCLRGQGEGEGIMVPLGLNSLQFPKMSGWAACHLYPRRLHLTVIG